jgi:hypothetical protein
MHPSRFLYGIAVFTSAFLLFLIEPIVAKQILPWLGGSSAVWMTCLVLFQILLLFGYLYAHWTTRNANTKQQLLRHRVLLAVAALLTLVQLRYPLSLEKASQHPVLAIFAYLGAAIGLPFLLLASTSPMLQVWMARQEHSRVRYRLFALSNAGSLLALLLYPTAIEPYLTLRAQAVAWSVAFTLLAVLFLFLDGRNDELSSDEAAQDDVAEVAAPAATSFQRWLWFLLPMVAAMQLSAVTEYLTQNVAAIPLLWILPLAVYLLSFILAFQAPRLFQRWLMIRLLAVMLASLGYMLTKTDMSLPIVVSIVFFLLEALIACWFFHSEAYALRPPRTDEATSFYLLMSAGGVAGSFFVGIACPLLFNANYDIGIVFMATAAATLVVTWRPAPNGTGGWAQRLLWSTATVLMLALLVMMHTAFTRGAKIELRNFYGSLRVKETHTPPQAFLVRTLSNGSIDHGTQWFAPELRRNPTTYYAHNSGIGLTLENCCAGRAKRVGVIGLGAGTLAAYGEPGDRFTFYEINPAVQPVAEHLFTYLRESGAQINFVEGDARISLESEPPQGFDVLAVDAFTGDAIPLHLLTREALALYAKHLAPGGVVAFHVSNQYLNLAPALSLLAAEAGMTAREVQSPLNESRGEFASTWVLVTRNQDFLRLPPIANAGRPIAAVPGLRLWTDNYSSLLPILRGR